MAELATAVVTITAVVVRTVVDVEVVIVGVVGNGTHTRLEELLGSYPSLQSHETAPASASEHVECSLQPPLLMMQALTLVHAVPFEKIDN